MKNVAVIVFTILLLIANRRLEKRFPRFYRRIELPCLLLASGLVAAYCGLLLYGVYDVLNSGVSTEDKVLFTIFIAAVVAVYGVILTFSWKEYRKGRKTG